MKHLGRLDNIDWEAPAVLYMSRNSQNPEGINRFLIELDRLAYGLFVWRANVNERLLRYARVIKAISDGDDIYSQESPLQLTFAERVRMIQHLNGPIYDMTRIRLPILMRLDEALSAGGATYDIPLITVEHVLPQNPKNDSKWMSDFETQEIRNEWVHRLANLVLLPRRKNSSAGTLDFDKKKKNYFLVGGSTPFAITSQVNAEPEWTPSVLQRRQNDLLNVFIQLWRLQP